MTLARWPNEGFVRIVDVVGGEPLEIHGQVGDKIGRFTYDGDRPKRWVGEKDVWLHGYWFWDWADQRQQVESIDTAKHVIRSRRPTTSTATARASGTTPRTCWPSSTRRANGTWTGRRASSTSGRRRRSTRARSSSRCFPRW